MLIEKIDELFEKIKKATSIEDIGYHQIKDGKLNPVYKSRTGEVALEKWKTVHAQSPVFIKENLILQQVINSKKTEVVCDVKADERSGSEFFLFGIDSIIVIPVIRSSEIIGIVPIVSIGKIHNFTQNEIKECEELVEAYKEFL